MTINANRPKTPIESLEKSLKSQGSTVNIAYLEIKKLKKVLKSEPKSLWKYLQKRES